VRIRGTIIRIDDEREVTTDQGSRTLVEVTLRIDDLPANEAAELDIPDSSLTEDPIRTLTLWGDWAETMTYAEPEMELLVTNVDLDEYRGDHDTQRRVIHMSFLSPRSLLMSQISDHGCNVHGCII
jgi:hypothetical protein